MRFKSFYRPCDKRYISPGAAYKLKKILWGGVGRDIGQKFVSNW